MLGQFNAVLGQRGLDLFVYYRYHFYKGIAKKHKDGGILCQHVKSVHNLGKTGLKKRGLKLVLIDYTLPLLLKKILVKNHVSYIQDFTVYVPGDGAD